MAEHAADIVNEPKHYSRWKIEPITYIMLNGFEFWRGNIIKYASRAGYKPYEGMSKAKCEITDLERSYVMHRCVSINWRVKTGYD